MMTPYYTEPGITIYHGDCREILPTLGKVDLVLTDPPYNLGHKYASTVYDGGERRMEFDFDKLLESEEIVSIIDTCLQLATQAHIFCSFEQFGDFTCVAQKHGFTTKPFIAIKKNPPPPMRGNRWPSSVECSISCYKDKSVFNDTSMKRKNSIFIDAYRHGIRAHEKTEHPTQKWLPMIQYLVDTLSREGETILDPFMGSGTTLRAAKDLGREAIGIEIEERYCEIAVKRLRQEVLAL